MNSANCTCERAGNMGYWLKLYHDILDDPKLGRVSPSTKWTFIACLVAAGEANEGGLLPELDSLSWRIRMDEEELQKDLAILANRNLLELRVGNNGEERWFVTNFAKRQSAVPAAERMKQSRKSSATKSVTNRNTNVTRQVTNRNVDIDIDIDKDREEEEDRRANPQVMTGWLDRSPGGINSVSSPSSSPSLSISASKEEEHSERQLTQYEQCLVDIMHSISDTTGISGKLNYDTVIKWAMALEESGYTAEQINRHYGKVKTPGIWNWYTDDWRGKKGDPPTYKSITETIVMATKSARQDTKPKRIDPAELLLQEAEKELNNASNQ